MSLSGQRWVRVGDKDNPHPIKVSGHVVCHLMREAGFDYPTLAIQELNEVVINGETWKLVNPLVTKMGLTIVMTAKDIRQSLKKKRQKLGVRQWRRKAWLKLPICWYCEMPLEYRLSTVDHIIPRATGGIDHATNYALACEECNTKKGANKLGDLPISEMILRHKPY